MTVKMVVQCVLTDRHKLQHDNANITEGSVLDFFPYDGPPSAFRFLVSSMRGMLLSTYMTTATFMMCLHS